MADAGAQVVLLGEIHDNPDHHRLQAAAVAAVRPAALVFEMLEPAQVAAAAGIARDDAPALSRAFSWQASGWPDFAMYAPIFAAAPGAALYAGGLPRDEVRRAVTDGAAAVFGAGAARFGLDRPLSVEAQIAAEDQQFRAHCEAMPRDMMAGMVEAQRLRDAALARAALQALDETGGPVVVIAGAGHAARDAVPAALALAAPGLRPLSVGQTETDDPDAPFDLWAQSPAPAREDPCASFAAPGGN
ncbi:ChaN family lipoprotein [Frigidibacter sp. MR17.24]|uniref:ChaN family lipoprotein n=1 Tax=Frigidibacter sp. MR17.24 TaxID=3127345 RepID=UPI003012A5E0